MTSIAGTHFDGLALRGTFRPYQRLALDAFEAGRTAGRTSTHLVAPPGSGKTVLGLEIVRRLGRPALVLAPTATIATQWGEKLAMFTDAPASYIGPGGPLQVLTYQAICQTADPGGALRTAACARLVAERATATGAPIDSVRVEVDGFTGPAKERFERDVTAALARMKRAVARGGAVDFQIPTPAVVRDGHLAPYQELAFFTTPLASEREWLADRHT